MSVIDDLLAKEPEQREVEFCADRRLREALSKAQVELGQARRRLDQIPASNRDQLKDARAEVDRLEARVDELVPQVREKLIRFVFRAINPERFDELKGQHRPTDRQRTEARKAKRSEPDFNTDTFPPVLVAAACVSIETPTSSADGLSLEDAHRLWSSEVYNDAERNELFNAAFAAQLTRVGFELPKDA